MCVMCSTALQVVWFNMNMRAPHLALPAAITCARPLAWLAAAAVLNLLPSTAPHHISSLRTGLGAGGGEPAGQGPGVQVPRFLARGHHRYVQAGRVAGLLLLGERLGLQQQAQGGLV